MKYTIFLFSMLFLLSLSFAIQVIEPSQLALTGGETIPLGKIGPGQTIFIKIEPRVTEGGIYGQGGRYDYAIATHLPAGWKAKQSKFYGDPMQVEISADKQAEEGTYYANITVADENYGELLSNITFRVKVEVTRDVLSTSVSPTSVTVGPEQPARYEITINNKGSVADVFEVSAEGVKRWEYKKSVYVGPQSSKKIIYEISEKEEERYSPVIKIVSTSSPLIHDEKNVSFLVKSDLIHDYKATNNGILIFPFFESLTYALAGLIANLF